MPAPAATPELCSDGTQLMQHLTSLTANCCPQGHTGLGCEHLSSSCSARCKTVFVPFMRNCAAALPIDLRTEFTRLLHACGGYTIPIQDCIGASLPTKAWKAVSTDIFRAHGSCPRDSYPTGDGFCSVLKGHCVDQGGGSINNKNRLSVSTQAECQRYCTAEAACIGYEYRKATSLLPSMCRVFGLGVDTDAAFPWHGEYHPSASIVLLRYIMGCNFACRIVCRPSPYDSAVSQQMRRTA
eukprot:COSAG01_NODE_24230_length_786_cov_0.733624_1_plen_239_part_10